MSGSRRILFATSNGTGLGHLTRSLAIARRLEGLEPFFVTFSAGAPAVARLGYPVEYLASYDRPGSGTDLTWTLRSRDRLRALVEELRPEVVLFDGTHPYERLLPSLRATNAPLVWIRRAAWRPDADTAPLYRSHLFDAVLEPGEVGEGAALGPTAARRAEARSVDPIVLLERDEIAERADAERALGIEPGRRNVLVSLGQGPEVEAAAARCIRRLARIDDVQVVAATSALAAAGDVPEGIVELRASYPLARHFAAFDAAIVAGGYNGVHELVALGVPSLIIPMSRETDDQAGRAREAQRAGVALAASGPADPGLEELIGDLLGAAGSRVREALDAQPRWRGAEQAADWVSRFAASQGGESGFARERPPAGLRVRARRAWIFGASVPRTLARLARQRAGRPRTRVVIVAVGLPSDRHRAEVESAIAASGEEPARILVVTDRLEFAHLLAAGVGFEHVPGADSAQARVAGVAYERFRERRIELILARRPRPRRVVELG